MREPLELQGILLRELEGSSLELEYAELRDPRDWTPAQPVGALTRAVALIAARAGAVRLIDNLRLDENGA